MGRLTLRRLAADVRRAEATVSARRSALYEAVSKAHADGRSYQEIAEEIGTTRAWVHQIVSRRWPRQSSADNPRI